MFIAALFTIARTWKQPKCPSTQEWIKMWYIYTMEQYSAIKRNETVPSAETWMDPEIVIQSEVSEKEKNKYCIILLTCGIQKNGTYELICKAKIESQMQRTYGYQGGKGVGGTNWEIGIDIYTLLCIKQITNENLLYSTGNCTQ